MPNFESFSRRMVSLKGDPQITIRRHGMIALNRPAFAAMGSPTAVELLYDRRDRIVGLRPVEPRADNAYQVRRASPSDSGPWVISAMAFIRFYDIDTSRTRRWPAFVRGDVLCADLSTEGTPVSSNRAHRRD